VGPPASDTPLGAPSAWLFLVRVHACRAGRRFARLEGYRYSAQHGLSKTLITEDAMRPP
jgi:hypothetical protein